MARKDFKSWKFMDVHSDPVDKSLLIRERERERKRKRKRETERGGGREIERKK